MIRFDIKDGNAITLTDAERRALIQLGRPSSFEKISQEAFDGLLAKGVTYKREDGSFDLTDLGESMYDYLTRTPCHRRALTARP
jgi:hypothetical protein